MLKRTDARKDFCGTQFLRCRKLLHLLLLVVSVELLLPMLSSRCILNMKRLVTLKYKQKEDLKSKFRKQPESLSDKEEALEC